MWFIHVIKSGSKFSGIALVGYLILLGSCTHPETGIQPVIHKKLIKAIDLFSTENCNDEILTLLVKLPDHEITSDEILLKKIFIAAGLCESGKVDSAYVVIEQVDSNSLINNPFLLFWHRSIMGLILFRKDELSKAYTLLCQPEKYVFDESAVGLRKRILGRIALAMNDYKQCLDWLLQSSQHFNNAGRIKSVAINEKMIGRCYMLIENYSEAIDHFKKAETALLTCNDELELFYVYVNILDYHLKLNHIEEAKQYIGYAQVIGNKFRDDNLHILIYNNLGQVALAENKPDEAILNFKLALFYCKTFKAIRSEVVANIGLADAMIQLGKPDVGVGYSQRAMNLAINSGQKLLCQMAYQNLARCYYNLDKALAFNYLNKAVQYGDSIQKKSGEVYEAFCQMKTELDHSLSNINQIKRIEKNRFFLFLGSISVLIIITLFLGKVYFSKYLYYRAHIERLRKENELVESVKGPIKTANEIGIKLSEEKIALLTQELNRLMEKERIYRNPTLTLHTVAEKLNTNREYLSQVINNVIGKNFIEYINDYRIEDAKEILAQQTTQKTKILNIAAIANSVGFKNTSTFNPIFKRATGFTPSEYKKALENTSELANPENIIL